MNIVLVSYAHLFNLGNYENERIEATSSVAEGEDEAWVLAQLKDWVHEQGQSVNKAIERRDAAEKEEATARNRLAELQTDIDLAGQRWEQILAFFGRAGLDLPQKWQEDDIPF